MSAVKALALSAVVLGAATQAATAGAIDSSYFSWISWTPRGVVQTPASSSAPITTASLFGPGSAPMTSYVAPVSTATPTSATYAAPAPPPAAAAPVATQAATPAVYDAFINLGNGPYPDVNSLTTGGAQPWYNSPQVASLFGGQINAQQRAAFTNAVVQRVEQTFALSGVPVTLTADPTAAAAHTLSVVSNTTSAWGTPVLGLTNVGGSGFDFIDQAARSAQNVDQLESIVAHNVSHELMLAFGVPENYDQTGNFIDATHANLAMMLNPKATFSPSASQALLAQNLLSNNETMSGMGAQYIAPHPVPEPATLAAWTVVLGGIALARSRRPRTAA